MHFTTTLGSLAAISSMALATPTKFDRSDANQAARLLEINPEPLNTGTLPVKTPEQLQAEQHDTQSAKEFADYINSPNFYPDLYAQKADLDRRMRKAQCLGSLNVAKCQCDHPRKWKVFQRYHTGTRDPQSYLTAMKMVCNFDEEQVKGQKCMDFEWFDCAGERGMVCGSDNGTVVGGVAESKTYVGSATDTTSAANSTSTLMREMKVAPFNANHTLLH